MVRQLKGSGEWKSLVESLHQFLTQEQIEELKASMNRITKMGLEKEVRFLAKKNAILDFLRNLSQTQALKDMISKIEQFNTSMDVDVIVRKFHPILGKGRKIKGGINIQGFLGESNRLAPNFGAPSDSTIQELINLTSEDLKNSSELNNADKEYAFEIMTNILAKGIYGDEFDKKLKLGNYEVFKYIQEVMRLINNKRKTATGQVFYSLPYWRTFMELYNHILLNIKTQYNQESAPVPPPSKKPPPPKQTRWYKKSDGKDEWYVNIETGEPSWELPPNGKVVPNPNPEPAPAPAPAPIERPESAMQPTPTQQKQIQDFSRLFREITIGGVTTTGLIRINNDYIGKVRATISRTFGQEILIKMQTQSQAYKDLEDLIYTLTEKTTSFNELSRMILRRFPAEYARIEQLGLEDFEKLVEYIQIYEAGIIEDFIRFRPNTGSGKRKCKKCGLLLRGKALPENLDFLQQMTKQSYNIVDPQENINGWILKKWTPTMKFWMKGKDVIVGVRGTKTTEDVMTWGTIPLNTLDTTIVYKRDKAAVQQFQQQYPKNEYTYYAVGHSLGGAIIDNLLRAGLIKEAVSYNPAIQYRDINGGLPNRRIYYGNDPLYRLMGWWDKKSEHREVENRTWGQFLSTFTTPGVAVEALGAHDLKNFIGGKKKK